MFPVYLVGLTAALRSGKTRKAKWEMQAYVPGYVPGNRITGNSCWEQTELPMPRQGTVDSDRQPQITSSATAI